MYPQQKNIFSDNKSAKRRVFTLSLWVITIILLIAVSLPFIIKQAGIHYFLERQNANDARINNVDLNLFAGHLVFDGVTVQKTGFETLSIEKVSINFDWLPLFSRQLSIRSFLIRDARIQLDISTPTIISVNGLTFATDAAHSATNENPTSTRNWELGLQEAHIVDSQFTVRQKELNSSIAIHAVTVSNVASWLPTQSTIFKTNLTIDNAPVLLEGTTKPFQPALPLTARFTVNNFDLARLAPVLKNGDISALKGTIKSELNINAGFAKQDLYDIKIQGDFNASNFEGEFSDNIIKQEQLSWSGLTQLSLNTHNTYFSVFNKGTAKSQGFSYISALTGLALSSRTITSEGQFNYETNPDNLNKSPNDSEENTVGTPFHFTGHLLATELEAIDHKNHMTLTTMQSLELPKIEFGGIRYIDIPTLIVQQARFLGLSNTTDNPSGDGTNDNFDNTEINHVASNNENNDSTVKPEQHHQQDAQQIAQQGLQEHSQQNLRQNFQQSNEKDFFMRVEKTVINNIQLNPDEALSITDILLTGTHAKLIKKPDGKWKYINDVISTFASEPPPSHAEPTQAEGNTSSTAFVENTISTPQISATQNTEGEIPGFLVRIGIIQIDGDSQFVFTDNSITPNFQTSISHIKLKVVGLNNQDKNQNSQIDFTATADDTAKIALNGFIQPFTNPVNAQIFGDITALELPPLSSYTASTLGYHLKRGRITAKTALSIVNGNLESKNNIVVSKLNLEKKDDEDIKNLTEELSMPLDKALDLLRDSDDNITISLPISGNVNDPNVDFTPIINKAMGKAIRSATLSYVEHALQPWSTLLTVAKIAGKHVNKIKLEPLLFNVGSAKIRKENYDYLNKISKLMKDRPSLEITPCGVSSLQDKLALNRMANNKKTSLTRTNNRASSQQTKTSVIDKKTLLTLAKNRAKNITHYLVNNQKIDSKRLYTCNPTYLNRKSAPPSVEFVL